MVEQEFKQGRETKRRVHNSLLGYGTQRFEI